MIPVSHLNQALDLLDRTHIRDNYFEVAINPIPEIRDGMFCCCGLQ